jgi:ElaB/YqjD/DUF883 family membrane-anchored ribosome-binding protein
MNKIGENIKSAAGTARTAGASAKRKATEAVDKSKAAASKGVETSKALARKASEKTGDTIDKNPLAIVAGGLALGAIVGMLLPKTKQEKKALGKAGKAVNDIAKRAAKAAKKAGQSRVDELGLNADTVRDQFRDLVSKASDAVKAAGKAAADEARKRD